MKNAASLLLLLLLLLLLMMMMWCLEVDSLLVSCCELEWRLERRRAELERVTAVHAGYRETMSRHREQSESVDTSQSARQLHDTVHQLNADSQLHFTECRTMPTNVGS